MPFFTQKFEDDRDPRELHLPHIGQRILKTTLAVFICLVLYWVRGYEGQNMPTEAAITAIVCMQPYVQDTRGYAENRFLGTLIGVAWGLLMLLVLVTFPALGTIKPILYAMMACGVMLSLYTAVLLRAQDASGLASIVFLCIVIAFPDIEDPLRQAGIRILDIFIGTAVAVLVNVFRLPRRKEPDQVFFLRTKDLAPDRFSHIHPAALFRLNYLYNEGARISLMSEHAPAFFLLQMSAAKLNTPMIVMDGAAIFDLNENRYLQAETLPPEDTARLKARLDKLGVSYFVYTIHNNKTCVFHHGTVRPDEQIVYDRMRRSPYRSYLEGEIYKPEEIVYIKIIDDAKNLPELVHSLHSVLPKSRFRVVSRPQAGAPGLGALYIYSHTASMEQAGKRLMDLLRQENENLTAQPFFLRDPYRSERDAIHLLQEVENKYAPVSFRKRKQ